MKIILIVAICLILNGCGGFYWLKGEQQTCRNCTAVFYVGDKAGDCPECGTHYLSGRVKP